MTTLDPRARLRPVLRVPGAWPASRALAALRSSDASFALVEEDGRPQSLLSEDDLERLEDAPPAGRLTELPALVVVDAAVGLLDADDLAMLAFFLQDGGTAGFLVLAGGEVLGAVSGAEVAAALPLDAYDRRSGTPGVPPRWFLCRKCPSSSPERLRAPLGGERPTCVRNWLHGPMEPVA